MNIKRIFSVLLVICTVISLTASLFSCKKDKEYEEEIEDIIEEAEKDDVKTNGWPEKLMTYEEYCAIPKEEWKKQKEYYDSFATPEDFMNWFNYAKKVYEESQNYEEIGGDGNIEIDMSK